VGLDVGLGVANAYLAWRSAMEMIENVSLVVALMLLGVGATWAVLAGLIYFFEVTDND
jgi:hypothetical protein